MHMSVGELAVDAAYEAVIEHCQCVYLGLGTVHDLLYRVCAGRQFQAVIAAAVVCQLTDHVLCHILGCVLLLIKRKLDIQFFVFPVQAYGIGYLPDKIFGQGPSNFIKYFL